MATNQRTVKIAPERREVTKIWNISDWPATSVAPQTLMALGVAIPPGGCIEVPNDRLKNAHKTEKDKKAGLLCIGMPPKEYLAWKQKLPRARLNRTVTRVHGPDKASAMSDVEKAANAQKLMDVKAQVEKAQAKIKGKEGKPMEKPPEAAAPPPAPEELKKADAQSEGKKKGR